MEGTQSFDTETKKPIDLVDILKDLPKIEDAAIRQQVAALHSSYHHSSPRKFRADIKRFLDDGTVTVPLNKVSHDCNKNMNAIPQGVPFHKHIANLQHLMELYNIYPDAEDFMGGKIDLTHLLDLSEIQDENPELLELFRVQLAVKQDRANEMLQHYVKRYGYQPLFRMAVRDYFTTDILDPQDLFWIPHRRGRRFNSHANDLCSQAIHDSPWLNAAEKTVIVQGSRCMPQDAEIFWRWATRSRLSYLAMTAIIQDHEKHVRNVSEGI
ncbi:hypothetical protein LOZ66_002733 [Ophidiomyces ophidiicola]|nr:hypothetical protein LOZ65_002541 [Ophidiomyces ophidiicola]KAI1939421.1 hypothetical protein LOZ66_002733 [Ophidiomyces ophidiicola]